MPAPAATIRDARPADLAPLARLWFAGWHEAHAAILPAELVRARSHVRLRRRLGELQRDARVLDGPGGPLGFCIVRGDELHQLYVDARARGQGAAAALLADAERRIAAHGAATAWLACAIGNLRAARFYEKCGWVRVGTMINRLPLPGGLLALEVWRYEKRLGAAVEACDRPAQCAWPCASAPPSARPTATG